jgi:outer membrane protein assembly factor BamA
LLILKKTIAIVVLLLGLQSIGQANSSSYKINKIEIVGNKKTKRNIILREMLLQQNDSLIYTTIIKNIESSKRNLFNTFLFNKVDISITDSTTSSLNLTVTVAERWYTYPLPIMEIADRNFNVWWVEQHHDIRRLNAGIALLKRNIRGRNETLTLIAQTGYTRQLGVQYEFPFIDKKMQKGLQIYSGYYQNKEVASQTINNKQIFLKDYTQFIRTRFQAGVIFRYRPGIYLRHSIELNFTKSMIADTLANSVPNYLLDAKKNQQFTFVKYIFEADHRNVKAYPLKGYLCTITATRWGLMTNDNVNLTEATALISKYSQLTKSLFLYNSIKIKTSLPERQPYNVQRAFGYGYDFVRGYEYYVIDGQHFGLMRNEIKWQILDYKLQSPIKKVEEQPFRVYLKSFIDVGYVKDAYYFKNNSFNNKVLTGYGVGLDVNTIYDIVMRLEVTRNHTGNTGIYLHYKANI